MATLRAKTAQDSETAFLGALLRCQAGGIDFAYRRTSLGSLKDPTSLVLLPGYGGTMSEWGLGFLHKLAKGREVIIFDFQGQGLSKELSPSEEPLSQQLVGSTLALLGALGLERPHLMGFSLGGPLALQMMAQAPERVGKVICLGGFPLDSHFVRGEPEILEGILAIDKLPRDRAPLFFPTENPQGREAADAWIQDVESMPLDPPNPATNARMAAGLLGDVHDREDMGLPQPGKGHPVLLLAGALDKLVPMANQEYLMRAIPGCSLVVFPEGGHGFFWQYPTKVTAFINAFLMPDDQVHPC